MGPPWPLLSAGRWRCQGAGLAGRERGKGRRGDGDRRGASSAAPKQSSGPKLTGDGLVGGFAGRSLAPRGRRRSQSQHTTSGEVSGDKGGSRR
jgi:hypothetical protein